LANQDNRSLGKQTSSTVSDNRSLGKQTSSTVSDNRSLGKQTSSTVSSLINTQCMLWTRGHRALGTLYESFLFKWLGIYYSITPLIQIDPLGKLQCADSMAFTTNWINNHMNSSYLQTGSSEGIGKTPGWLAPAQAFPFK
jgi:hypothetical protein